ncbi:HYR domain-containing protein [Maribacter sp.]
MKMRTAHTFSKLLVLVCLVLGYSSTLSAQADFVGTVQTGPLNTTTPFSVTVELQSSAQLVDAAEVHLTFDTSILQVTSLSLGTNNTLTSFVGPDFDNSAGTIDYAGGIPLVIGSTAPPVDANFDVLVIEFQASQTGTTSLNYVDPDPPFALTVAYLAGVDVLNEPDPIALTIVGANGDPVADFTATPNPAETDQIISFNASTSSDPDDDLLTYEWDFGDGTTGNGQTIDHAYTAADTYNVVLTVTDGNGGSDTENIQVVVNAPTVTTYVIAASAGPNGSISPNGDTAVIAGGNQIFTITPESGYEIDDVLVGGISQGPLTSYEFMNVSAPGTIAATFKLAAFDPIYVNCGGGEVSTGGITFLADTGFTGGTAFPTNQEQVTTLANTDFANTSDDEIYRKERFGDYSYNFNVPNGDYIVDLYIAEIFQGVLNAPSNAIPGKRIFNVNIEGNAIELDNFDALNPNSGGAFAPATGLIKTFVVTITDGVLTIATTTLVDNAKLSAIGIRANDGSANSAPAITTINDITVDQGDTISQAIAASDVDGITEFQLKITNDADDSVVPSSSYTLTPNGNSADFEWITVAGDAGEYTATLLAFDGKDVTSTTFAISIGVGNNAAPTIGAIADIEVKENESITIPITVTDDTDTSASIVIYDKSINTTPANTNTVPYTSGGTIAGYTFLENPAGSGNYVLSFASGIPDSRSYFARITANDGVNPAVTETFIIDVAHPVSNDANTPSVLDATTFSNPLPWYGNSPGTNAEGTFTVSIENSGTNIGYIENGDFVEYLIDVPEAGLYEVKFTSANGSGADGSSTDITMFEEGNPTDIGFVTVPKAGWSNYKDFTKTVAFAASGPQTLRLEFDGGVNTQKLEFSPSTVNTAPVVTIETPADGIALTTGTTLNFSGTANDFQDGDLSSTIVWTSDIDGQLGVGADITAALSTIGTHIITAETTDSDASPLTGTATVTLVVTEIDPSCDARFRVNAGGPTLLGNSGDFEEDQAASGADAGSSANPGTPSPYVNLDAPAMDKTFGSLTPLVSNTTGYPDFLFQTERYSTVANPDNMNWSFPTGDGIFDVKILFNENWNGEGGDPRVFDVEIEGDIALDDYRPSVDGTQINVAKVETYRATVRDGILNVNFLKGTQNPSVKGFDICFISDLPNEAPEVTITAPADGANVIRGASIPLTATATDTENGDISDTIEWLSSDTEFGTDATNNVGSSVNGQFVKPGPQTLTANVFDLEGELGTDQITVNVSSPEVVFTAPSEGDDLSSLTVNVTVDPTSVLFDNTEHFHFYINPPDIDNLDSEKRISTAGSSATTFEFNESSGLLAKDGAGNGIVEGQNTILVFVADKDHVQFPNSGAMDMITFTVTLPDTTPPTITCPDNIVVDNDAGVCGAVVAFSAPVGEDNLPGAITRQVDGPSSGDTFPIGETTVTFEVEDAAGNKEQCSFTVTVNDTEAPKVMCPPNISVTSLDGSSIPIADIGMATASDNCGGVLSVTGVIKGTNNAIPAVFPVGTTIIVWSTVDEASNVGLCEQSITVNYTPSTAKDITAFTLAGQVGATTIVGNTISLDMPAGSDVGNLVPASLVFSAGASIEPGTNVARDFSGSVDYTVTAQDNSQKIWTVDVTVLPDSTPPTITCPGDIVVDNDAGECGAAVAFNAPVGEDNLPGAITSQIDGPSSGDTFPIGETTVTFEVEDAAGNKEQCSFTVTVNDTEAPEVTCPPNISVTSLDGSPMMIEDIGFATASDNCPGILEVTGEVRDTGNPIPNIFPVGTTIIRWSTVDSNGIPGFCDQSITVSFTPSTEKEITAFTLAGQVGATTISGSTISLTMPIGSDVSNLVPASLVFSAGASIEPGTNVARDFSDLIEYTVTAQDNSEKVWTVNVTVLEDTTPPTITCPGDIVVANDTGVCGAAVAFSDPVGEDDLPGAITKQIAGPSSGDTFPIGETTVTFEVEDAAGNKEQCSFTVTVNDTEAPVAVCSDTTIQLNASGTATINANILGSASSDNCGIASITSSKTTFTAADLGANIITLTVTDLSGTQSTCTSVVTVEAASVGNTQLTVLDATTDEPLFDLVDGLVIKKSDIGNTPLGIIFNASFNPNGVFFKLSGPITQNRGEGQTPPYSLFGDIGVDIQGMPFPVGNYTLSANPKVGPTIVVNFEVTDVDPACENFDLAVSSSTDPTTCNGTDGEIVVNTTGSTSLPVTYSWSHDANLSGNTATGLEEGTYSVTASDGAGCSETVTITLDGPPLPTVTLAPFANVLETASSFALTGGLPAGGTYSGQGVTNNTFDPSIGPGSYSITYTYTDGEGCSNSASRNILVTSETANAALIVLDARDDTELFALTDGLQINKSTIGEIPLGVIYNTNLNPNGVSFKLTGPLTQNRFEGPAPHSLFGDIGVNIIGKVFPVGNYTLVANPNNGPAITVNFSVVEGNPLCDDMNITVQSKVNPSTCGGSDGAIVLSITGAVQPYTYSWSHDNSLQSSSAAGLTAGTYSVTVTDANGCSDEVMTSLSDPAGPNVTLAMFDSVMDTEDAFDLTGGMPVGGTYSGEGVSDGMFDPSVGAGTYAITYSYTDSNTGCDGSAVRNITVTTVNAELSVLSFTLVNANTSADILTLTSGAVIAIGDLPTTNLNIRANTTADVGSVSFTLTGAQSHGSLENVEPYALFGDSPAGVYVGNEFITGNYVVSATPHSLNGGGGATGTALTIGFTLQEATLSAKAVREMTISPNPVDKVATLLFETPKRVSTINVYDSTGRLAKTFVGEVGEEITIRQIPVQDLPSGTYFVRTIDASGKELQQQMAIKR